MLDLSSRRNNTFEGSPGFCLMRPDLVLLGLVALKWGCRCPDAAAERVGGVSLPLPGRHEVGADQRSVEKRHLPELLTGLAMVKCFIDTQQRRLCPVHLGTFRRLLWNVWAFTKKKAIWSRDLKCAKMSLGILSRCLSQTLSSCWIFVFAYLSYSNAFGITISVCVIASHGLESNA